MIENINFIIDGILEVVKTNNIYDILSHFNIKVLTVDKENPILHKNQAVYHRFSDLEIIYLSNEDNLNREFILAHEIGHAILHDIEMWYFSRLGFSKAIYEKEADYFAFKLLNKIIDKTLNYTVEEYAKELCVSENVIKYVVGWD